MFNKILHLRVLCVAFVVAVALGGCVSGRSAPETYTSPSGAVTAVETDRETCIRACNNDYERCGDRTKVYRNDKAQDASSLFGVDASCKDDLKSCLPRCKAAR